MSDRMKPPGRCTRTVRRLTGKVDRHWMLLGCGVAAVALALAWIGWQSVNGVPFQNRYEVHVEVPADAPILKEGDAVRMAGRFAGLITDVAPDDGHVLVTAELRPDFAPLGRDSSANVKVRSIVYLTYLELFPGNVSDPMPEGGTIPLARSGSGVDLLEVTQLFDRKARRALSDTVSTAGTGFAGRGTELNAGLADLGAAAPDLTSQLRALTARPGALSEIVAGGARVMRGIQGDAPDDLGETVVAGGAVLGALASRDAELGASVELLRPFEDELLKTTPLADPVLDDLARTDRALAPAARSLAGALPELNRALALGDQMRVETARLTEAIDPVLKAAAPVLADLQPTVASIKPLLGPLRIVVDGMAPYAHDIELASRGIVGATDNSIAGGKTAPGNPALRFTPVLTCHRARDPYPEPGETLGHSEAC
jgi:ABC-type transporter Mla subunit MlaD